MTKKTEEPQQKVLTVAEVVSLMRDLPQDAPVWIEGCDCIGHAFSVTLETVGEDQIVMINRGPDR